MSSVGTRLVVFPVRPDPTAVAGGIAWSARPVLTALLLTLLASVCGALIACGSEPPPAPPTAQRAHIFLIARADAGRTGKAVACGDSVVPVTVMLPAGEPPLRGALRVLLELRRDNLGGPELINPLVHSRLQVVSARIEDGRAEVHLRGELRPAPWPCNPPRIRAQLEETALQFDDVREAVFLVNGRPLNEVLERKGGRSRRGEEPLGQAPPVN